MAYEAPAIYESWIQDYIYWCLEVANRYTEGPLRDAAQLRAVHAMDLLEVWRREQKKS